MAATVTLAPFYGSVRVVVRRTDQMYLPLGPVRWTARLTTAPTMIARDVTHGILRMEFAPTAGEESVGTLYCDEGPAPRRRVPNRAPSVPPTELVE